MERENASGERLVRQVVDGTGQHVPERIQRCFSRLMPVCVYCVPFRTPDDQVRRFLVQVLAQVSGKTGVMGVEKE